MATVPLQMPELVRAVGDGPPLILHYPEAASQLFKKGAALKLAAGAISLAAATDSIIGFAAQDASGTTGQLCPVMVATPSSIFNIQFAGATGTSLVGKVVSFVTTSSASITASGTGAIFLSSTTQFTGALNTTVLSGAPTFPFIIVGLDPRDNAGDTNGRCHVVVRWQQNAWLFGGN